jgi:pilus assembly protein CpaE
MNARGHFSGGDDGGGVMHGEFMAFLTDEDSVMAVRDWAGRQGFPGAAVQTGGPDMFSQMLESAAPPKLVMVDIDGQSDALATAERLINLCGPDSKIIIVGSANDVSLYRKMLVAGVVDYLVKPLASDVLNQAMTSALRGERGGKTENREARIIVVIGVRGGVGASTTAVNTGWLMSHNLKLNGALLDLDLQFGTTALALDLEPGRGLRDIVNSPHRVDGLMIASSMVPESDRFSVLGAEEAVDELVPVDGSAITALLKEMKDNFDFIIIDMPRYLLASQKRLLAAAHEIVLVTELSLAGIRDTLRIRTAIVTLGCTANVSIVASRVSPSRTGQVDVTAFEKGAQIKIDAMLPEDQKIVAHAANSGKSLGEVAPQSPLTKALLALATKISGNAEVIVKKDRASLWKKLSSAAPKKTPPKERSKA